MRSGSSAKCGRLAPRAGLIRVGSPPCGGNPDEVEARGRSQTGSRCARAAAPAGPRSACRRATRPGRGRTRRARELLLLARAVGRTASRGARPRATSSRRPATCRRATSSGETRAPPPAESWRGLPSGRSRVYSFVSAENARCLPSGEGSGSWISRACTGPSSTRIGKLSREPTGSDTADLVHGRIQAVVEVDKGVGRPEQVAQLFAGDHGAGAFEKYGEHLEGLPLQAEFDAVFAQFARTEIEFKDAEARDAGSVLRKRHRRRSVAPVVWRRTQSSARNMVDPRPTDECVRGYLACIEGLQCVRACFGKAERRGQASPPSCSLRVGDHGAAPDCLPAARADPHPLLARHSLELALNVDGPPGRVTSGEPVLVAIVGPTASGKTALSLALADRFGGEIVNCDSVAMYREFDIGTAKPTAAEQARAPHHLFDCVAPTEYITAGEYARRARQVLGEIAARGNLPIVVGGTGLYLRALLDGLFPGPQRSEELRQRLREGATKRGSEYLHRILQRLDRAAAEKIHANDVPKLIRAIEVCLASRQKMTELWQQGRDPLRGFRIVRIGLDPERAALYERINARASRMFEAGLVDETERLWKKYGEAMWPLASLGYRQALQLVRGEVTREQAVQAAQQAHRNYAKRQLTWFRREPDVAWLNGFGDEASIQADAVAQVEGALPSTHV